MVTAAGSEPVTMATVAIVPLLLVRNPATGLACGVAGHRDVPVGRHTGARRQDHRDGRARARGAEPEGFRWNPSLPV